MDYEYRYIHPQDGLRWFHCRGRRMQDERRMFGVIVDVTDRKRAEEALRSGEEAQYQLAAIVASSDDAIIWKNLDGIITSWNASAERMFGYTAQEAVGSPITIIIPPELHTFEKEILARLRAGKRIEHYEAPRLRKDGSAIDVSITISPIRDATGRIIGASNVTRDITERKRAEEVMKEREISGRLLQLQDQERRHIARELHDSLGQLAAGISIGIGVIGRERSKLSESAAGSLTEIAQFIDQLSAEIRTISYLLHPPLLDEIGLASALTWYVDGFAERSKVDVDLEIPDDLLRLPQDYELTLFRIVQECLTNIHRHSGSATATVRLSQTRGEIVLEVRDQGRGINPAAQARINAGEAVGVGLRGMRERVRPLGGTMKVESDTTGTSVTVTLPLPTDGDRATAKES
jgi:PAS domain S-box-containing protein